MLKELADRLASILALALVSPLLIVVALLVRWRLGSPVLFLQQRPGYRGKPYVMLKFRSMTNQCDEMGILLSDDQRLTPFGRWLRQTSLDELPALLNIARGEMSFVGPRPLLIDYLPLYSPEQARRHDVKPGLTGWAQINGRNALSWEQKFHLDVWYIDNLSLWLDLRIIVMTVWIVLRRKGIAGSGQATMAPFKGSPSTSASSLP